MDTTKITAIIEEMVAEKTLSMDMLHKVYALKEAHDQLVATCKKQDDEIDSLKKQMIEKQASIDLLRARVMDEEQFNKNKVEFEKAKSELAHNLEILNLKRDFYKSERDLAVELFGKVFANSTLRKSVNTFVPGHTTDNGSWASEYQKTNVIETKEI